MAHKDKFLEPPVHAWKKASFFADRHPSIPLLSQVSLCRLVSPPLYHNISPLKASLPSLPTTRHTDTPHIRHLILTNSVKQHLNKLLYNSCRRKTSSKTFFMPVSEIMSSVSCTHFTVSYQYYRYGIPADDPIIASDKLETFQEAVAYARGIQSPSSDWISFTPEEWDFDARTGKIVYYQTVHGAGFAINIHPTPKFNVSICWYVNGVPATNSVLVVQGLGSYEDAIEDARQVKTKGEGWSGRGIEMWDSENGRANIRYYHLVDDEFFEVVVERETMTCDRVVFNVNLYDIYKNV